MQGNSVKHFGNKFVIGIDEVGRGALGGPVTVAAFALSDIRTLPRPKKNAPLRDSKRLTPRARERWFNALKGGQRAGVLDYRVARVSPRMVDRMNISRAANLAATRAYERLVADSSLPPSRITVLLDGGLFIHPRASLAPRATRTIVRGDEKIPAIQLASIVAKVTRDRAMVRLHAQYPAYGFAVHKGYGTRRHRAALRAHGVSGIHRLTFLRKFSKLNGRVAFA